jgi:hypothetical protein
MDNRFSLNKLIINWLQKAMGHLLPNVMRRRRTTPHENAEASLRAERLQKRTNQGRVGTEPRPCPPLGPIKDA